MGLQHVGADSHAFRAIKCERPQVGTGQSVFPDHRNLSVVQGLGVVGDFHSEDMGRSKEPVSVVCKPEDGRSPVCLIGPHALEHTQPVVESVSKHMYLRIPPRHHLAVKPDYAVTI